MSPTARTTLVTAAFAFVFAGCGGTAEEPEPPEVVDEPGDEPAVEPDAGEGTEGTPSQADLDAAIEAAVDDLAAADGVDPDDVAVVSASRVSWPDGSLGCPQPGQMYTQAIVPGYRIVLAADGDEVAYHGAEGDTPARCDDPRPPADGGT